MKVTTQSELDAALSAGEDGIIIDSPAGVWLKLESGGSSSVVAWGSSRVVAWGSSSVVARDSSSVEALDSSSVVAWGSSRVVARGSSSVVAWGSSRVVALDSSSVVALDSSRVEALDSSSVVARGSSSVEALDSSRVEALDSSSVVALDSSRVEARGFSSVEARGSSRVEATKYVAVHLFSQAVTLDGGVLIDMTAVDAKKLADWCDLTGVKIVGGQMTVYKAVDDGLRSEQGFEYPIGTEVTDTRWRDDNECGAGLHFSPTPAAAKAHYSEATRFLECLVAADEVRCIDSSKLKAPRATVVREVTLWREAVEAVS